MNYIFGNLFWLRGMYGDSSSTDHTQDDSSNQRIQIPRTPLAPLSELIPHETPFERLHKVFNPFVHLPQLKLTLPQVSLPSIHHSFPKSIRRTKENPSQQPVRGVPPSLSYLSLSEVRKDVTAGNCTQPGVIPLCMMPSQRDQVQM